jgi:hypothetical protein
MSNTINLQERWCPRLINSNFYNYIISEITDNHDIIKKTKEIEFILLKCKNEYNNNKLYYDTELTNIESKNKNNNDDNTKIEKLYTLIYVIFIQDIKNEKKLEHICYIINIINTENLIDNTMLNSFKIKKSENYLYYLAGISGILIIGAAYLIGIKNIKLPLIINN